MKRYDPTTVTATFVSAVLSLILPASAMPDDEALRAHSQSVPIERPQDERARSAPFRNDPILQSPWGPGDPNLAVPKFHFELSGTPKDKSRDQRDSRRSVS